MKLLSFSLAAKFIYTSFNTILTFKYCSRLIQIEPNLTLNILLFTHEQNNCTVLTSGITKTKQLWSSPIVLLNVLRFFSFKSWLQVQSILRDCFDDVSKSNQD